MNEKSLPIRDRKAFPLVDYTFEISNLDLVGEVKEVIDLFLQDSEILYDSYIRFCRV